MSAAEAISVMARWRDSPLDFTRECLGAEPDAWQQDVLEAIARRPKNRYAMKASKGPGKTTLLAWVVWWFLATRTHPKVVATSITEDNLKDGLWAELAKWQANAKLLQRLFTWSAERISNKQAPKTWFASARTWRKDADATKQADTLAGIHADNVLFVLDEVGGIPDAVAAAAEAGLANAEPGSGREALLIIAGNPTHNEGPLYRACTTERDLWWTYEISGDPDDPRRAPRVSIQWAREQIAKYGRNNPWVLVNVFGKFPPRAPNTLLGPDDITEAMRREYHPSVWQDQPRILGVDVARFGDDRTVIQRRQGQASFTPKVLRKQDTMAVVGFITEEWRTWQPDAVFVDNGTFGAGVVDRLRQLGYRCIGVDFGGSADDEARFLNKRAEMWWRMADWVREGQGALYKDPELAKELVAPTYKMSGENVIQLEAKADIKKRLGYSPDLADALALTFAYPVAPKAMRKKQAFAESDWDPYYRKKGAG